LVARAQQGDGGAVDLLLRRHYDRLYAVCFRVAGNEADAADGCQEALMAIARGLPNFDGRSSFKTWSYRVATNACLDELRRRKRRPAPVDDLPESAAQGSGSAEFGQQVADRLSLEEALADLEDEFRLPVLLRDVTGMDYREIAETLQIPPGTVRSRIARGRRKLAQHLGNQNPADRRPNQQ
jgi:RNA polymerase sigma-70 factor (ECF subfamily)